jgi:hypothetical protein
MNSRIRTSVPSGRALLEGFELSGPAPEFSWAPFEASWGTLGHLWEPLGSVWGPWVFLRTAWGVSWGLLGASWSLLKRCPTKHEQRTISESKKGGLHPIFFGGVWEAKIDKNRTQDKSKIKTIFKNEKNPFQDPLGAVLRRSWAILEALLGSNLALRYWNS